MDKYSKLSYTTEELVNKVIQFTLAFTGKSSSKEDVEPVKSYVDTLLGV